MRSLDHGSLGSQVQPTSPQIISDPYERGSRPYQGPIGILLESVKQVQDHPCADLLGVIPRAAKARVPLFFLFLLCVYWWE